jgi:hypothetical protein
MAHQLHPAKLLRLSAHLEELFSRVSAWNVGEPLPPELADEIAVTAGEVMIELADRRGDELARGVVADAHRLREVVRAVGQRAGTVAEVGRTLVCDLEVVIREQKRAA